jgi:membrane protease YdiL (CAAX protease family)
MKRDQCTWLALGFALVFPAVIAWIYFVALATEGQGANPGLQATYSGGKVVQFSFPLVCLLLFEGRLPRLARPTWRGLAYGVGFGLLVAGAMLLLYFVLLRHSTFLGETPAQLRSKVEQFGMASPAGFVSLAIFLTVLHSLMEEYYWRWFVFSWLRRQAPLLTAIVVSSLGFMAHHVIVLDVYFPGRFLSAVVPFSLCIAVGGAFWAWLYQRTGSIYAPWLSHLLVDAAIMLVGYDLLFGMP